MLRKRTPFQIWPTLPVMDRTHPFCRGLVNWWPLTEIGGNIARDIGLTPRNGTFSATVSRGAGRKGAAGPVPNINGQWIDSAPPTTVSGTFTVGFWFYATSLGGVLFSSRQPVDNGMDIQFGTGGFHGDIGNGSGWITTGADATFSPTTGVWYLGVYVVTPTTYTIYWNNAQVGSGSYSTATPLCYNSTHTVQIGTLQSIGGLGFPGRMSNFRIWNRALSGAEVAAWYRNPMLGALGMARTTAIAGTTFVWSALTPGQHQPILTRPEMIPYG